MQLTDAIQLIQKTPIDKNPSAWADLGSGDGTFTKALASLLYPNSTIYAIDKTKQRIASPVETVNIEFVLADFEKDELSLPALDGILMANSLHYIKDKDRLLNKLSKYFKGDGQFIIIEYDTLSANQWVPYPLDLASLQLFFAKNGFKKFELLGRKKSVYGRAEMVSCWIG